MRTGPEKTFVAATVVVVPSDETYSPNITAWNFNITAWGDL